MASVTSEVDQSVAISSTDEGGSISMTDIKVGEADAEPIEQPFNLVKTDAEAVQEYSGSALDDLLGFANDTFGEKISSMFGDSEDDGPDVDVILLLITLAISKLGITLNVGIDWDIYEDVFGWLSALSFVSIPVPTVNASVISSIVGTALLLVQPMCLARMHWLAAEHQHYDVDLTGVDFLKPLVHFQMFPRRPVFCCGCCLWFCSFHWPVYRTICHLVLFSSFLVFQPCTLPLSMCFV